MASSSPFRAFLRLHLPPPPARVLEVGSGLGELTTTLFVDGYDVLGIDPLAPPGDRFRRIRLEDLGEEDGPFDAVVAARALHPIRDLDHALDLVRALLRPGGVLGVDELGWDLLDEPTLAWLYEQRRARGDAPASLEELRAEWEAGHLGIHGEAALLAGLRGRFEERAFERTPFLYRLLGGRGAEVLEQSLVDAGAIRPLGFRWAGVRV
jgi:SAM-dependent methyltransferase